MIRRIASRFWCIALPGALIAGLLGLTACGSSPRPAESDASAAPPSAPPVATIDSALPRTVTVAPKTTREASVGATGVLSALQNGDRACYVVLNGGTPQEQTLPGSFDLCEGGTKDATKMIGAQINYRTERAAIAAESCQGAPDCAATDQVDLVVDLVAAPRPGASSALEIEGLVLGTNASDVVGVLGAPTEKTLVIDEAATGEIVSTWTWASKGVQAKMTASSTSGPFSLGSLTISSPSALKTVQGIGLGASSAEVRTAYDGLINSEESTSDTVVVGSIFGGILFTIADGKVTQIFVGAAAE